MNTFIFFTAGALPLIAVLAILWIGPIWRGPRN